MPRARPALSREARLANLYAALAGGDGALMVSTRIQSAIDLIPHGSITAVTGGERITPAMRSK